MDTSKNIEDYFTPSAWKLLSEYERRRYENLKSNYKMLKDTGITSKIPQFMTYNNQKHPKSYLKSKVPQGMIPGKSGQRTKLKLFGVPKQSNRKKETSAKDENALVSKNTLIYSRKADETNKLCIRSLSPKEFSQIVLQSTKNVMNFLDSVLRSEAINTITLDKGDIIESKARYPERNIKRKSYKEEDVSSDDDFLHCDDCDNDYKGACPVHGPMILVCDTKVAKGDPDGAVKSLPPCLSVSRSVIPKAGLGVWTETPLIKGMLFGPYRGTTLPNNARQARQSGYAWQVWKGSRVHHYVEGADQSESNWMRFVNCAQTEERQNVVAIQFKRGVYYKTYKDVLPFTELLVWYGDSYAADLGIDTKESKELQIPKEICGFACDVCDSLFSSSSALQAHRKTHPQPDRRHKCPHCPYSTDDATRLRYHLLTHTGERPHTCTHCHKGFTRKADLKRHLRVHTGEKPFSCSTCGRRFNWLSILRTHERTHADERRHRCSTCGKDYSQAGSLKKHARTHTLQRPYRCPHCDYRTTQTSSLRRHIVRIHTRDFGHTCSLCGKGFFTPKELMKHVEKVHQADQVGQEIG